MNETINLKKKIRQELLHKRKQLSNGEIQKRSEKICKQLVKLEEFQESKTVLIFVSMPDEVQTNCLFRAGLEQRKLLAVPIVQKKPEPLLLSALSESHIRELLFSNPVDNGNTGDTLMERKVDSKNTNWTRSAFGILEPHQDTVRPVSISEIDLIVVPGLGFDKDGMRIGFGGGHYDRLLAKTHNSTLTVAVAFDFQIHNNIPHNDHDKKVDMVITDREVITPFLKKY